MRDDHATAVELPDADLEAVTGGLSKSKPAAATKAAGRGVHSTQEAGRPVASGPLTALASSAQRPQAAPAAPRRPAPESGGCAGGVCSA